MTKKLRDFVVTLYPAKLERGFVVTSFAFGQDLPQKQFQAATTEEALAEAKVFATEHGQGCQASIRIIQGRTSRTGRTRRSGRKPAGFDAKTKSLYFNLEPSEVA